MTSKLRFAKIKKDLTALVNNNVRQYLNDREYDKGSAQSWCDGINAEIINDLRQQQTGFKFIIHTTISKKGESSLHFSNNFLWNKKTDGSIFVRYENATLKCFVSLYGMAPEKKQNLQFQYNTY